MTTYSPIARKSVSTVQQVNALVTLLQRLLSHCDRIGWLGRKQLKAINPLLPFSVACFAPAATSMIA
jgi:hypothetical protein